VYSGAYQLPALPDSAAITKRLHAFYSRVNPAKAEQVRSSRAQTSKSERAILDCYNNLCNDETHIQHNMKQIVRLSKVWCGSFLQAALVWKTLQREYGANATEELNKMLR
jgi:hypothetical protein